MNIKIDKARPADAAELLAYLKQIGSETDNLTFGAEGVPFSVEAESEYLRSMEDSPNSALFIARLDGRIIGNASFSSPTQTRLKHRGELGISVSKEAWGKGIGTKLLETVIDFAKNTAGAQILFLEVRSDNARAIHLYEKFGFAKTGVAPGLMKVNGELIDFDLMNLYL